MFNYKTWKLYYPGAPTVVPDEPVPDPVVDENGNSITPDSLKKNITIPAEAPGNDLEKVLSNMNGTDPAYPVEGSSGLIKQLNKFAENPPSSGVFVVNLVDNNAVDKTMGEIQEAWARNDRIVLQGNSGGGIFHSIAVYLLEVHLDGRENTYDGGVGFATISGVNAYRVTETTEAAALNAYPTIG